MVNQGYVSLAHRNKNRENRWNVGTDCKKTRKTVHFIVLTHVLYVYF